jgi:hypothetical protein
MESISRPISSTVRSSTRHGIRSDERHAAEVSVVWADIRGLSRGVGQAEQSDRLKGAAVVLYLLGISYRGVEDFLTALGCQLDRVTVYRDVQEAGEKGCTDELS